MATINKVTRDTFTANPTKEQLFPVYSDAYNSAVDQINTNTTGVATAQAAVDVLEAFNSTATVSNLYTKEITLTATEIVGTAAGDIGHSAGAIIVAAPSSDYALEFVSAVLIYNYATAAYTGGDDDMVFRVGTVAQSGAVSKANCLAATGDKVYRVGCIATELSLPVGSTINLSATAFTQPGTAAGTLSVRVNYRIHTTGL